jgi:hypothetical protein
MKRQTILGTLAVLAVIPFLATPAFAIANPPPPPANCTQINGAGAWPLGAHTYRCGGATPANATLMMGPLNNFPARANTEMLGLTGSTNRGNFYLFDTQAEYAADFPAYAQPLPDDSGVTANDAGTGAPIFTAIFQKNGNSIVNAFIANATAHELGHWLDALSGAALSKQEKITLNGTVTVGHTVTITIDNGNIPGSPVSLPVTSIAGDTLTTLATKFAAAVNANAALASAGITATSSGVSFTTTYTGGGSGPVYSYSISGAGGITEQVWLDTGTKASASPLFAHSLHGNPANTNGDIFAFNQLSNCNVSNSGVFNQRQDSVKKYICSTKETGSIGGSITINDQLTLTITDPSANGGNPVPVHVQVLAGYTTTTIATKFAQAINANASLIAAKITATSSATVLTVTSGTGNPTTYSYFNAGGTETMGLANLGLGRNSTLSTLIYSATATNWTNLQLAYPNTVFNADKETWAEYFATLAAYDDRSFPVTGVTNYQSLDWYFTFGGTAFQCIRNIISVAENTRLPPTNFPAGCPAN